MTTVSDVDRLRRDLDEAEAKAAGIREAAAKAEERRQQRRAEAERRFDEDALALYNAEALEADVTAAQRALEEALDADPVVQAAVRLRAAQGRRHGGAVLHNAIAQRLGQPTVPVPGPGLFDLHAFVTTYVERTGARLVADDEDAYWKAREAAASD
jgi:hypothetical protein